MSVLCGSYVGLELIFFLDKGSQKVGSQITTHALQKEALSALIKNVTECPHTCTHTHTHTHTHKTKNDKELFIESLADWGSPSAVEAAASLGDVPLRAGAGPRSPGWPSPGSWLRSTCSQATDAAGSAQWGAEVP